MKQVKGAVGTITIKKQGIIDNVTLNGLKGVDTVRFEPILFYPGDQLIVTVCLLPKGELS